MAGSSGACLLFGNGARRWLGDFTKLLPKYGPSYSSADLAEWLDKRDMGHVRSAPAIRRHGKIERWHQTLKNRILLEHYYLPGDLEAKIDTFVDHHNHRRRSSPDARSRTRHGLLLGLGLFQRDELGLGQDQAFLGALGLQGIEPLVHGLEVMTLPHATHAGGRDREPALPQLVGDANLTESRLLDGNRNDGVFDLLCGAVFQHWRLAADLLQHQLAAFVIEFLEAVEAVAAVTHHLAGLADIAELPGKL
jgi:hypothetical protein